MKKIKSFLKMYFSEQFSILFGALLIIVAISFGLQSLLFRMDGMPNVADFHIWHLTCGEVLNMAVFTVVLTLAWWFNMPAKTVFGKGQSKRGAIYVLTSFTAVLSMYIGVIVAGPWWLFALCCVIILLCELELNKTEVDTGRMYVVVAVALAYCVGAYFAMSLNEIEPTINNDGICALSITTLAIWFWPSLH